MGHNALIEEDLTEREIEELEEALRAAVRAALDFEGSDVVAPLAEPSGQRPSPSARFIKDSVSRDDVAEEATRVLRGVDRMRGLPGAQEFAYLQHGNPTIEDLVIGIALHTTNDSNFTDWASALKERSQVLGNEAMRMANKVIDTPLEDAIRQAAVAENPYQEWDISRLPGLIKKELRLLAEEGELEFKAAGHLTGRTAYNPYPDHLHPPSVPVAAVRAQVFAQVLEKKEGRSFDHAVHEFLSGVGFETGDWGGLIDIVREQTKRHFHDRIAAEAGKPEYERDFHQRRADLAASVKAALEAGPEVTRKVGPTPTR